MRAGAEGGMGGMVGALICWLAGFHPNRADEEAGRQEGGSPKAKGRQERRNLRALEGLTSLFCVVCPSCGPYFRVFLKKQPFRDPAVAPPV